MLTTLRDDPPHPETINMQEIQNYTSPLKNEEGKIQD